MIHPQLDKLHLNAVTREQNFSVGDTVRVHYKIIEGNKERIQIYEGLVIAINNKGAGRSFTVRRVSYDVGVERVFPLYSPNVDKIEKVRSSRIRRSKLYYLRDKIGKGARLKEATRTPDTDSIHAKASEIRAKAEEEEKLAAAKQAEAEQQAAAAEQAAAEAQPAEEAQAPAEPAAETAES